MKTTDTHVYFWRGVFSNWHPAEFTDALGNKFANSEQAFMYYKALFFGDLTVAAQVVKETNPAEVKKFGRMVKGFDGIAWDLVKVGFMEYVNLLKYRQNEEFRRALLDTKDFVLVEASPYDKIWGVGLSEDDPEILIEAHWKGENLLGYALMKIRSLI